MNREDINELKVAYRALFEQGKPLQEVAQSILESTKSDKVKQLCKFIKASKRGIAFKRIKNEDKE